MTGNIDVRPVFRAGRRRGLRRKVSAAPIGDLFAFGATNSRRQFAGSGGESSVAGAAGRFTMMMTLGLAPGFSHWRAAVRISRPTRSSKRFFLFERGAYWLGRFYL